MRTIISTIVVASACLVALPASAAETGTTFTIRTGIVDAIRSIALNNSEASVVRAEESMPIAIYRLNFSLTAAEEDIIVPLAVTRGESEATGIEFEIESRNGEVTKSGRAVGMLIPHGSLGTAAVIKAGATGTFTLLVAYTDVPDSSREDRLRVTGMTLKALSQTAELNPSEVSRLQTDYVELIETR